ncbi:asparagine synthase-related protein [Dehalobacter sp. UNSWDHB]|uniref:asparagine synthase-related protein n=1 Tax=Dehalobacter sp. UNSWDHB TaxID=1339256 RepID=UPI0005557B8C|nr:asparagine synthase-related protein [Dehalobacter sp. UNSWDHB]
MEKLANFHAGMSNSFIGNNFFFGCRLQTITPESELEQLPYHDEQTGLTITADAIIDNRAEILRSFGVAASDWITFTDSQIILWAYQKWGNRCPEFLIGDYAFAIFDHQKNELFCARDHVGKRTFYYTYSDGIFSFCTLMKPLLELPRISNKFNDQWLADFLAIRTVRHEIDSNHTVYQDIHQLLPAHIAIVNKDGLKKHKYWDPLRLPEIRFKDNEAYVDAFREIFFEAVECRTRSTGPVGIMLSGGLDSGSVACIAAKKLQKSGQSLKGYSSIPMEDYKEWLPPHIIADERPYIEEIIKCYPNIEVQYCRSENRNSYSEIDKFLEIMEQPYKTIENLFWIDNIAELASKDNCKVLLDGQFGNSTISFGSIYTHVYSLLRQVKLVSAVREATDYCKINRISRKKMYKYLAHRYLPQLLPRPIQNYLEQKEDAFVLINRDLAAKYNTRMRLAKAGLYQNISHDFTVQELRKETLSSSVFSHLSAIETKFSLKYGFVKRDPTRDKRVVEFCFRIPEDQYVDNGQERLLIRKTMKGILPDKVRMNTSVRGLQSADWLQRLDPAWEKYRQNIIDMVREKNIESYIDKDAVLLALENNRNFSSSTNQTDIRMLITCIIMGRFLDPAGI